MWLCATFSLHEKIWLSKDCHRCIRSSYAMPQFRMQKNTGWKWLFWWIWNRRVSWTIRIRLILKLSTLSIATCYRSNWLYDTWLHICCWKRPWWWKILRMPLMLKFLLPSVQKKSSSWKNLRRRSCEIISITRSSTIKRPSIRTINDIRRLKKMSRLWCSYITKPRV